MSSLQLHTGYRDLRIPGNVALSLLPVEYPPSTNMLGTLGKSPCSLSQPPADKVDFLYVLWYPSFHVLPVS